MVEKNTDVPGGDSNTFREQALDSSGPSETTPADTRRTFLSSAGSACMVGGLVAGYGTLGYCALRFLTPDATDTNLDWQFVATLQSLRDTSSYEFTASSGAKIVIARAAEATQTGFLALSSVCPHLGCQVFWEAAKDRFFCPCHNGVFDKSGQATSGPPADANQSLTQYPTRIQNGALYVMAPLQTVTEKQERFLMGRFGDWFAERIPVEGRQLRELTNEPVPNHLKNWWFCLGGTPAYLFLIQIVTGILLAFYYQPTTVTAYESVRQITEDVSFGWYIRSLHKWAATLMIATMILHQMRVFFTGAYRRPREINWVIGMCILMCTLLTGFTGYSLVFEQLSFWGATVAANISDSVPLAGSWAKQMLLAGPSYNEQTLPRFYILHAAVLPATIILLLGVHIALIRLHGISELSTEDQETDSEGAGYFNFFPDHVMSELMIGLALMTILSALATVLPATMGPRADALVTPEVIKPEWFFYVSFRWLKMFSLTFAVLSSGLIVLVMVAWPWFDAALRRITRVDDISVYVGILATLTLIGLTVWEALVAH